MTFSGIGANGTTGFTEVGIFRTHVMAFFVLLSCSCITQQMRVLRLSANTFHLLISFLCSIFIFAMNTNVISRSPEVMGGTPVFDGTRVPVQTLIDYLEGGESIDDFLKGFPTVSKAQVIKLLEEAKEKILVPSQ